MNKQIYGILKKIILKNDLSDDEIFLINTNIDEIITKFSIDKNLYKFQIPIFKGKITGSNKKITIVTKAIPPKEAQDQYTKIEDILKEELKERLKKIHEAIDDMEYANLDDSDVDLLENILNKNDIVLVKDDKGKISTILNKERNIDKTVEAFDIIENKIKVIFLLIY